MKKVAITLIVFLFLSVTTVFATDYPDYKGYVNNFADVLSDQFEEGLEQKLSDFDLKTTNQLVIVTLKTTQPDTIEQYSIKLAEKWKPGQKDKDNGVIMLFAMEDRKMRIEVGRGLEGELTDVESKHILDKVITPEFKQQKYEDGISKGVDAVILAIATDSAATTSKGVPIQGIIILIIAGVIIFAIVLAFSSHTPLGGEGDRRIRGVWVPKKGSRWGKTTIGKIDKEVFVPIIPPIIASSYSNDDDSSPSSKSSGSGWGGVSFGGGQFSGGGSTGSW